MHLKIEWQWSKSQNLSISRFSLACQSELSNRIRVVHDMFTSILVITLQYLKYYSLSIKKIIAKFPFQIIVI